MVYPNSIINIENVCNIEQNQCNNVQCNIEQNVKKLAVLSKLVRLIYTSNPSKYIIPMTTLHA